MGTCARFACAREWGTANDNDSGARYRCNRPFRAVPYSPFPRPYSLPFLAVPAAIVYARAVIIILTGDTAYGHADY